MSNPRQLGVLQLAILRVLWRGGPQSVVQVHVALSPERRLSPSTIGTMLQKMERKGVVRHARDGRRYLYRPTVAEDDVQRGMVNELKARFFGGDPLAMIGHLVRVEELCASDLERLRAAIEERARAVDAPGSSGAEKPQEGA